eukprot:NODE_4089_length_698_cov_63.297381_g3463_i0.p1 GENE.NODE_4089_length_698_cov_63.297381_g3463_i0~~NODE_4089_length_698_cov_63.297381_g3463_i0.p1  ORF type:complete len:211 (+),score=69.63 NODE_4089_length_698_cov_63.297381_g3463_i0:24-635(+)
MGGLQTKDDVFAMTDESMDQLDFTVVEKDGLRKIILSQQSNWVAQERLNQLYPLRPLPRVGGSVVGTRRQASGNTRAQPTQPTAQSTGGTTNQAQIPQLEICSTCHQYIRSADMPAHKARHDELLRQQQADEEFARKLQEEDASAPAPASAPVPAPVAATQSPYASQASKMIELGFTDTQQNIEVLGKTNGNVQQAINMLLGQ